MRPISTLATLAALGCAALLVRCAQSPESEGGPTVVSSAQTPTAATPPAEPSGEPGATTAKESPMPQTEAEWRTRLTDLQFNVLRQDGTERAYTGEYLRHAADGVYACAGCGQQLYESTVKFDQGGWPSFHQAIDGTVETRDVGGGVQEVHCARCKGHLGHIFNDGPGPARKRH